MSDWKQRCQNLAAAFVNGLVRNEHTGKMEPKSGAWAPAWLEHRLVQRAEVEGWGRELRMHVKLAVTRKIMEATIGKKPEDGMPKFREIVRDVADFMPDAEWIEHTRAEAARYAEVQNSRQQVDHEFTEMLVRKFREDPTHASVLLQRALTRFDKVTNPPPLPDVSRPAMEKIRSETRNTEIHFGRQPIGIDFKRRAGGDNE